MRAAFIAAIVVGLVAGGIVAGVRLAMGGSGSSPSSANLTEGTPAPAGSAAATAQEFAKRWSNGQYETLYALLDPASQAAHEGSSFVEEYEAFADETTETDLQARVSGIQANVAMLAVHLATAYFGDLEYSTTLNLVQTDGRWLVQWDRTAIHPDLTGDLRVKSDIQRPTRGKILDRNGVPLAITEDVRMLGLNRSLVTDRATLTAKLVEFGFAQEVVDKAFASTVGLNQRVAVGPVSDDKAEAALTQLAPIPGVLVYFESQRVHPLGAAAAHVIGYTREFTADELAEHAGQGLRAGDRTGATGLEASQDAILAGHTGASLRLVAADGSTVKTYAGYDYVAGEDVVTTLDATVLEAAQARLGSRAGAAVVIDPRTNAVLALNSSPSFDPDAFERNDAAALAAITSAAGAPQTNRATHGLYSAGSTFKLVTGAAGLAYGGYTPSDQIYCGSTWDGVDPPRRNWEGAQGPLTIAEGLMRSCNPVFYEIGLTLYNKSDGTNDGLAAMARALGFGSATGIQGLGEEDGLVPDAQWKKAKKGELWFPGDEVNLAIGQGDLLITPLQLANAYSSFLAGELRVPIVLASATATDRGEVPLSAAQSATLRQGLKLVTGPNGTASAAFWNAGYTNFGGKSGTAEDVGAQQHVLFVAFAPADAPVAVCAVVLDEGASGSIEAGPIARDIVLAAEK